MSSLFAILPPLRPRPLIWTASFAAVLYAGTIGPPLPLGFLIDDNRREARPLVGVLGAAVAGARVTHGLEGAEVLPSLEHIVGRNPENGNLLLWRLGAEDVKTQSHSLLTGVSRFVLSPNGNSLVAYSSSDKALTVIDGLPREPRVSWKVGHYHPDETSFGFAINQSANKVALLPSTNPGTLRVYDAAIGAVDYSIPSEVSSLAFVGRDLLLLLDRASGQFYTFDTNTSFLNAVLRFPPTVDVMDLGSMAASIPIVVGVEPSTGRLVVGDISSGLVSALECECQAVRLRRANWTGVYQVNSAHISPIWLLKVAPGSARLVFVPFQR